MVTRNDVAKHAGVSTAVVSYVLNDGPRPVSDRARKLVLEAVEALGYRPDGIARSFRTGRTNTIGLVVPDNSNPFFAELVKAIEEAAFARGLALLVGNSAGDASRERAYVQNLVERRVDGLLLITVGSVDDVTSAIDFGIPVVVLDRVTSDLPVSTITVDNAGGAAAATTHLLEHGHRGVDFIGGPHTLSVADAREAGWRKALHDDPRATRDSRMRRTDFGQAGGYEAAKWLLRQDDPPTAIFVASDAQAMGVLAAIHHLGLTSPEDVAVMSFDGTDAGRYTVPELAAVAQPIAGIAALAVGILVGNEPATHPELPFVLRPAASCGCG